MNKELSLEDAWDNSDAGDFFTQARGPIVLEPHNDSWKDNDGLMPDIPHGTIVDITLRDDDLWVDNPHCAQVENYRWTLLNVSGDIIKWRFHKPEDAEYYKQPKTAQPSSKPIMEASFDPASIPLRIVRDTEEMSVMNGPSDHPVPIDRRSGGIDSHYNFSYRLTQWDVDMGSIKLDPYFVSQQWNLGSKDSTGVIFHLLKTIARFGDKNGKEREINALHKSVLRLAQLEGVELK
jgi:hypothetical protein